MLNQAGVSGTDHGYPLPRNRIASFYLKLTFNAIALQPRANCAGALQYVPELTWILFLRILDEQQAGEAEAAEAVSAGFTSSLEAP